MLSLFKNTAVYAVLFFVTLLIDICFKHDSQLVQFRFLVKPLPVLVSMLYFLSNVTIKTAKNKYMLVALLLLFLAEIVFLFSGLFAFGLGMGLFFFGRLFYGLRFSTNNEYSIAQVIPLLVLVFVYMVFIVNKVYDNLGYFFVPVILYLFVVLLVLFFAFFRKDVVNTSSFLLVFIGVVISVVSDSLKLLQVFSEERIPYEVFLATFLHGLSQFLIVMGVTQERLKTVSE